ncbi:MAG: 50S ribosomal protein L29 [Candidatus Methanomethyliaceae archaeon]|nr:50S ribosomal protein L29 [Candidatus Methanomethyliaceae archaeon]
MAIFRIQEIRKMSKEERNKKLSELRAELSKMKAMQAMGGSLENPSRIRLLRKTIAQFLTVNREEELGLSRVKTREETSTKASMEPTKETKKEAPKTPKLQESNIYEKEESEEKSE